MLNRIFPNFGTLSQAQYCSYSGHIYAARHPYHQLRPTPLSVEIVFHSESGICTIVSQPCFTTRNLRTKLCGIRSQTEEQEFVDPFKSWYLETLSISEMEKTGFRWTTARGRSELKSGKFCTVLLGTHFYAF